LPSSIIWIHKTRATLAEALAALPDMGAARFVTGTGAQVATVIILLPSVEGFLTFHPH